jgi:hypothetical protein
MKRTILAALTIFVASTSARAADIKFCFLVYGDYTDAGDALKNSLSEDYWTVGSDAHYLRGAGIEVRLGSSTGTLLTSGSLGDGLGTGDPGIACTETITLSNVNQTYWYKITSVLDVNLNTLTGKRDDLDQTCYRSTTTTISSGAGTYDITISGNSADCEDVFRATSAAAFSLYRHNGGNSGESFNIRTRGSCENTTSGTTSCLSDAGANRKFTVSHEFGHALIYARDSFFNIGSCSFNDTKCPSDGTGSINHAMASEENGSCALKEAFAHFVAADTYNNHSEDDCAFNYYKSYFPADPDLGQQVVDCEVASTDQSALESGSNPSYDLYPLRTMESVFPSNFSVAGCTTPFTGKAVEVDYLRVLWNMHTDSTSPPTFTSIVDWLVGAGVSSTTCFSQLDSEANTVGGQLNTNWDTNKTRHGVDH